MRYSQQVHRVSQCCTHSNASCQSVLYSQRVLRQRVLSSQHVHCVRMSVRFPAKRQRPLRFRAAACALRTSTFLDSTTAFQSVLCARWRRWGWRSGARFNAAFSLSHFHAAHSFFAIAFSALFSYLRRLSASSHFQASLQTSRSPYFAHPFTLFKLFLRTTAPRNTLSCPCFFDHSETSSAACSRIISVLSAAPCITFLLFAQSWLSIIGAALHTHSFLLCAKPFLHPRRLYHL